VIPRIKRDQVIGVMLVLAAFFVGQYLMGDRPISLLSNQIGQVTSH
jgi:hypothetical protein